MEGLEVTSAEASRPPVLTDQERRILEMYDRLEELQLEIALLKSQGVLSQGMFPFSAYIPEEVSEEAIQSAQQELLDAKAAYTLRSNVVESTIVAAPILKAVHAGTNASVIEQDLLPLIEKRDEVSLKLTRLSTEVKSAQEELIKVQSQNVLAGKRNVELSTTMLDLSEKVKSQSKEDIQDPKIRRQLDQLEAAMKESRQKWRIMKGTAGATIVGSGINWAQDPELLDIVLDNDATED
ncbi:centromere protein H (CENP-H)-domain-containing protein [Xylogone sp. PMI_703]|nr:centromere protein H (CENP-H)-domain-containing protein [Xylogone sp. PMI_703]